MVHAKRTEQLARDEPRPEPCLDGAIAAGQVSFKERGMGDQDSHILTCIANHNVLGSVTADGGSAICPI